MTLRVLQGSHTLGFVKGRAYPVLEILPLGPDYSHQVRVTIQTSGRTVGLYARHINRLMDEQGCNLNNGDPTKSIRVKLDAATIKHLKETHS